MPKAPSRRHHLLSAGLVSYVLGGRRKGRMYAGGLCTIRVSLLSSSPCSGSCQYMGVKEEGGRNLKGRKRERT